MNCIRCHRPLSDPISIKAGMGPVCRAKSYDVAPANTNDQNLSLDDIQWAKEEFGAEDGDFIFRRTENGAKTNVPHVLVKHSPTGLEWGYGGSGPADTALNILHALRLERNFITSHYQEFKWRFVATLPTDGGIIKREDVFLWHKQLMMGR